MKALLKNKWRVFILPCLTILFVFGMVCKAKATPVTTLSYTDTGVKVSGFNVAYTLGMTFLETNPQGQEKYQASLQINPSGTTTPDAYYADWFIFKFDGSTGSDIINVPSDYANWDPIHDVEVYKDHKQLPQGGFSGIYLTGLNDSPTNIEGVKLSPGMTNSTTLIFDVTLPIGGTLNKDSMPFQVGYYTYNSSNNKVIENNLSESLTSGGGAGGAGSPVPEPATLLLLGLGLLVIASIKLRKTKAM